MAHAYSEWDGPRGLECHYRVHGNNEQTHVFVLPLDGDDYAVVALDTDPVEFDALAAELVGYEASKKGAQKRAERWMQTHTKGVLGESGESNGGGVMEKVLSLVEKADQQGEQAILQEDTDNE